MSPTTPPRSFGERRAAGGPPFLLQKARQQCDELLLVATLLRSLSPSFAFRADVREIRRQHCLHHRDASAVQHQADVPRRRRILAGVAPFCREPWSSQRASLSVPEGHKDDSKRRHFRIAADAIMPPARKRGATAGRGDELRALSAAVSPGRSPPPPPPSPPPIIPAPAPLPGAPSPTDHIRWNRTPVVRSRSASFPSACGRTGADSHR